MSVILIDYDEYGKEFKLDSDNEKDYSIMCNFLTKEHYAHTMDIYCGDNEARRERSAICYASLLIDNYFNVRMSRLDFEALKSIRSLVV